MKRMKRMKTFNCSIEESLTLEEVQFKIQSTSEDAADKYCQVIANAMPKGTVHYTEEKDRETYWYVSFIEEEYEEG